MARIIDNIFTQGICGEVGGLMVFRSFNDKTYVYKKARKPTTQSPLQKENRSKFRKATAYAKQMMADPEKKATYWEIAKRLKLPNAYTAAITDYMRKAEIIDVDKDQYSGKSNEEIKVMASKKDFSVESVEIAIVEADGTVAENGAAVKGGGDSWVYMTTRELQRKDLFYLVIKATEGTGRIIERKVTYSSYGVL
jgi:hypothetical protein